MLRNPHVAAYLAKRQKEVTEQAEISTHEWAMHLKAVTFSKVGDIFDNEGRMIPLHELAPQVQASISSFEARRGENGTMTYSVKFWPKPAGLDIMARHLGLFKADNDQRPKDETPLKIEYIGD